MGKLYFMTDTNTFAKDVGIWLFTNKKSNRWLLQELKERYAIELTDTTISNRINEVVPFLSHEVKAINEILETDFKI